MFTGLIESLGRVVDVSDASAGKRLLVKPETTNDLNLGESVAVNGVCLTVVEAGGEGILFDVSRRPSASRRSVRSRPERWSISSGR